MKMITESRKESVLSLLREKDLTVDEISYALGDGGKQHLYTAIIKDFKDNGIIIETDIRRTTSNGGIATVLKYVPQKDGMVSDFIQKTHSASVRVVTFEEAKRVLKNHNWFNRRITTTGVNRILKEIQSGYWSPTSCLIFDKEGRLQDGQHRLTAQVKAGVDLTYVVQVGAPECLDVLDTGTRRTGKQSLYLGLKRNGVELDKTEDERATNIFNSLTSRKTSNRLTGTMMNNRTALNFTSDEENVKILHEILDAIEELEGTVFDFKAALMKKNQSSNNMTGMKRAVEAAFAEMYVEWDDKELVKNYFRAVFGRYNAGVFNGMTPESVKQLYTGIISKVRKGYDRAEQEMYGFKLLVGGLDLIAAGHTDLKPNSVHFKRVMEK